MRQRHAMRPNNQRTCDHSVRMASVVEAAHRPVHSGQCQRRAGLPSPGRAVESRGLCLGWLLLCGASDRR